MTQSSQTALAKLAIISICILAVFLGSVLAVFPGIFVFMYIGMRWGATPYYYINLPSVVASLYLVIHPVLTDQVVYVLPVIYFLGQAPVVLLGFEDAKDYSMLQHVAVFEAVLFVIAMARFWFNGKLKYTIPVLPTTNVQMLDKA